VRLARALKPIGGRDALRNFARAAQASRGKAADLALNLTPMPSVSLHGSRFVTWAVRWRMMADVRRDLPAGTVTFLFTDVEGSTKLLHELGAEGYSEALTEHRRVLREVFGANGGVEVDTQGDAVFVAFPTAPGALRAAADARERLAPGPIRVRMGVHTGTPVLAEEGYIGVDVHRAARIAACGHGGQVLVSASTAALLGPEGLRDLGEHRLKDLTEPQRFFQLGDDDFPPLKTLHQTNLPVQPTPLVGRERELSDLSALLFAHRLLTVVGPGAPVGAPC
jgi:class 3 adenylate cyclase